jgi:hypothetical protein
VKLKRISTQQNVWTSDSHDILTLTGVKRTAATYNKAPGIAGFYPTPKPRQSPLETYYKRATNTKFKPTFKTFFPQTKRRINQHYNRFKIFTLFVLGVFCYQFWGWYREKIATQSVTSFQKILSIWKKCLFGVRNVLNCVQSGEFSCSGPRRKKSNLWGQMSGAITCLV